MTTEELQRWVGMSGHYGIHINGKVISDIAAELIAARAKLAAAERLADDVMAWRNSPRGLPIGVFDALEAWEAAK